MLSHLTTSEGFHCSYNIRKAPNLGQDKISRLLFQLALPAILAQLINLLYNMVDRMYIGHIPDVGPNALTGVGVTLPLIMCISAFAALVSMGGAPRASIMMGKGEPQQAERILGNCASMLVITALVLTVVIQCFGQDILMIFGASSNTISYAWDYMKIYSLGTLFVQLALGLNAFINAQGFARTGMLTVTIGAAATLFWTLFSSSPWEWACRAPPATFSPRGFPAPGFSASSPGKHPHCGCSSGTPVCGARSSSPASPWASLPLSCSLPRAS